MARFALLVLLLAAVCASSFQTTQAVDASFRVGIAGTVTGPFAAVFAASNVSFQMWADYVNGPSGGIPADGKKYGVEFVCTCPAWVVPAPAFSLTERRIQIVT